MQPSEMTNEELAFYIVNTIGGGIFKEYYTEAAARLRLKQQSDNYAAAMCHQEAEYKREICDLCRRLKVAEVALEKCVNYNNSWELEAAKENAKNALAVIRGKGANDETK